MIRSFVPLVERSGDEEGSVLFTYACTLIVELGAVQNHSETSLCEGIFWENNWHNARVSYSRRPSCKATKNDQVSKDQDMVTEKPVERHSRCINLFHLRKRQHDFSSVPALVVTLARVAFEVNRLEAARFAEFALQCMKIRNPVIVHLKINAMVRLNTR